MRDIDLVAAQRIIRAALAFAIAHKFPPMGIIVLDAGGHVKAFEQQDRASLARFDIARGKAWTALAMGVSSRKVANMAKKNPNFFLSLACHADQPFVLQPGGILIRNRHGHIIGAVGASGGTGTQDEKMCLEAVSQLF